MNLFSLCLQHTSLSPDGKLLVIVGDNPEALLVDSQTGKVGMFLFVYVIGSCSIFPKGLS